MMLLKIVRINPFHDIIWKYSATSLYSRLSKQVLSRIEFELDEGSNEIFIKQKM